MDHDGGQGWFFSRVIAATVDDPYLFVPACFHLFDGTNRHVGIQAAIYCGAFLARPSTSHEMNSPGKDVIY